MLLEAGSNSYDPEAIYQDADLEMMELQQAANHNARLEREQEKCGHHSWVGLPDSGKIYYPEQEDLQGDEVACTAGCGRKFSNEEAMFNDRYEQGFI